MRRGVVVAASVVGVLALVYVGVVLLPRKPSDDRPPTVVVNETITLASPDGPLSRGVVTSVFAGAGEPLVVRLDFAMGDPDSPVDVIYVPADEDVQDAPFELTLFDDVESAKKEERLLQDFSGSKPVVARAKNALLIASMTMPAARRARLVSALKSLEG